LTGRAAKAKIRRKQARVIKPGVPAPNLAPLMGAETVRERGGVTYREIKTRSLLNRCDSPRMPFTWTVNPYRGCAMGCRYCYAAYTHEYLGVAVPEDFHSLVYIKTGGEEETARRLRSAVKRGELIALGAATDPYQPVEVEARVTRRFLEMVARHRNVRLGIVTKGAVILRDLDVLETIHRRSRLWVRVSLASPHADLLRRLDPWAPPPAVRIEMMKRLHEIGIDAGLGLAPVLPAITDDEPSLDRLLGEVAAAGIRKMFTNVLFLKSPTKEKYLRWLAAEYPRYLEAYERAYAGRVYLEGRYRDRLKDMIRRLRRKHGFEDAEHDDRGPVAEPEQLGLFP
jgi:DNA repair photolyase